MVLYFILFVFNLKINVIDDYHIRKIKKKIFVKKNHYTSVNISYIDYY